MLVNSAIKVLIEDVVTSRKYDWEDFCRLEINADCGKTKVISFNSVWLQGKIVTVIQKTDKISVMLQDETGKIRITYIGNTPLPWVSKGVYCSAVGKVIQSNGSSPEVEAVKMTDLSSKPILERMWPLEVKEVKLLFLELIKPSLSPLRDLED